ncbi:putative F-box protein [Raphanus sativus]|nr:putative F-box protein [Raphanus sativus]
MTLISDLPNSLVEQILTRLPLKSMRAVRLTCKEWDTLSKSRSFAKMHIDRLSAVREGECMVITIKDNNLYLSEDQYNGKFVCLNKQIKISQVFHCDGLLLYDLEEDDTKVIVWNPYWGQTRSIETRYYDHPYGCDRFSYALGYEDKKSCRSYKILRFIDEEQFVLYEIYDLDSGLWRTLDVTPYWRILFGQVALSLKGNTYWPASRRNSVDGLSDDHIICF